MDHPHTAKVLDGGATGADVYSLGVLLCELLTGTKPFDLRAVIERGFAELLRTIREVDPERPELAAEPSDDDAGSAELRRGRLEAW